MSTHDHTPEPAHTDPRDVWVAHAEGHGVFGVYSSAERAMREVDRAYAEHEDAYTSEWTRDEEHCGLWTRDLWVRVWVECMDMDAPAR